MEDKAKKRREYLWSKVHALMMAGIGSVIVIVSGFAGPYGLWASFTHSGGFEAFISSLLSLVFFGALVFSGARLWIKGHQKARSISYVPPVYQQVVALPADEILLRGSDSPAAAPCELLRAVQEGTETDAGELLRVNY